MVNKLEVSEKESGAESTMDVVENEVSIIEERESPQHVFVAHTGRGKLTSASEEFTRNTFEDALDKVSQPVKGKYAHVPYSSEDLIRDKRTETELEDS